MIITFKDDHHYYESEYSHYTVPSIFEKLMYSNNICFRLGDKCMRMTFGLTIFELRQIY